MADMKAEYFVFFVGSIAMFFFMLGLMPYQFYMGDLDAYEVQVPSFFTPSDIAQVQYMDNATLEYGGTNWAYFDIGSEQTGYVRFKAWFSYDIEEGFNPRYVELYYISWYWWIFEIPEYCHFTGARVVNMRDTSIKIRLVDAVGNWYNDLNASRFEAKSASSPNVKMWITDTNTSRSDIGEAWIETPTANITITLGMGIDAFESSLASYDFAARLLTFQSVEVYGMPRYISYPINVFFLSGIGYCLYCLIVKVIPLVSG